MYVCMDRLLYTVSAHFISGRCRMYSIQRRVSYCANTDSITSLLTFATSCTGCQFNRIEYKMCVLVYKCLHQSAPIYLSESLHPGCSNCHTESFTFSSARQPRHLELHDKAIWTQKLCIFRAGSLELTSTDSS